MVEEGALPALPALPALLEEERVPPEMAPTPVLNPREGGHQLERAG